MAEVQVKGKVRWFNATKGYGFITPENKAIGKGKDVFVHYRSIVMDGYKTLEAGMRVVFTVSETKRGPEATKVMLSS